MTNPAPRVQRGSRPWVAVLAALACGYVAYCNSFRGPFIFDDIDSILDNPQVNLALPASTKVPPNSLMGRPVLRFTFWANDAIGGLNVLGYHAVNLAIHLCCGALLVGIIGRNLSNREFWGERFAGSADWLAGAAAAMWLVHPLNTEAVTYIVQRAESLSGMFYFAVIYCLIRAAGDGRGKARWSIAAVIVCGLGMGTKETMVTAPLIALFYDRTFLAGSFATAFRKRWRLYLGLAATWILLAILLAGGGRAMSVGYSSAFSVMDEARTQPGVIAHYVRLALWPRELVLDYCDWPVVHRWTQIGWGGYAVLAAVFFFAIAFWKKPWLGFLGTWFFVILSPSSSFVPIFTEIAAEHRMYLPLAAPIVLAVVGCWILNRFIACALVIGVIVTLSTLTLLRNQQYESAVGIWSVTVAQRPLNARAHMNLGYSLMQSGRPAAAVGEYQRALALEPDYYAAASALGHALVLSGDRKAAEDFYTREMKLMPAFAPEAHLERARLRKARGDLRGAIEDIRAATGNVVGPH